MNLRGSATISIAGCRAENHFCKGSLAARNQDIGAVKTSVLGFGHAMIYGCIMMYPNNLKVRLDTQSTALFSGKDYHGEISVSTHGVETLKPTWVAHKTRGQSCWCNVGVGSLDVELVSNQCPGWRGCWMLLPSNCWSRCWSMLPISMLPSAKCKWLITKY